MSKKIFTLAPVALAVMIAGCNSDEGKTYTQPSVQSKVHEVLNIDGYTFRDANGDGELTPYEDWRLPVDERISDLLDRMTLEEKVGMMLIDTLYAEARGTTGTLHKNYIHDQHMTRFIFRNTILTQEEINNLSDDERDNPPSGPFGANYPISPMEAAQYMNAVQEEMEKTRLGIPALHKSNARNHIEPDARAGINVSAGAFTAFPKEGGLAAMNDMDMVAKFAEVMKAEWNAIGLRGMYGYMADLSTEPRWYRVHETFTEDADLASDIIDTLVTNLQGNSVDSDSIVLTLKHFPGGGPQFLGLDPHYQAGQHQSYPAGQFDYHVKPFKAAIDAGVASIMPYYGIVGGGDWSINSPDGETNLDVGAPLGDLLNDRDKDTVRVANNSYGADVGSPKGNVGSAFSKGILDDLLRKELGFKGVINSDTGIIGEPNAPLTDYQAPANNRAWGLQDKTQAELFKIAIEAGTDVFSGFHENANILDVVTQYPELEEQVDKSVARLLKVQFELGLFEDAYVDASKANEIVANPESKALADEAQRKAVVLLDNKDSLLPLPEPTELAPVSLFTMGMDGTIAEEHGYNVTVGDNQDGVKVADATGSDYALIRVRVSNTSAGLLYFGGSNFNEISSLDFTTMASTADGEGQSWKITPSLEDIQAVMEEVGAENTVLSVYFRQPYVLDEASGMNDAGAILATFGSNDAALMDVVTGKFTPSGKLPFALANKAQAIIDQASDAPGYAEADTLYPFGYGMEGFDK